MTQFKPLVDEYGIIYEAMKILPDNFKIDFLEVLAELENNECYQKRNFPKTRLHVIKGIKGQKFPIYRADIDKISGWRLHLQYFNGQIHLKDIISGQRHDDVIKVVKSKKDRYE